MKGIYVGCLLLAVGWSHGDSGESDLWGSNGEKWNSEGRLPDFSFAGYHRGEKQLPKLTIDSKGTTVTQFGAIPNDGKDDTQAFQKAIAEAKGLITIPGGRYIISDRLHIRRSGVVLVGAGTGKTVLYFPQHLTSIEPKPTKNTGGTPTSSYSWSGGFIKFTGGDRGKLIGKIVKPVKHSSKVLWLDNVSGLKEGDLIRIRQRQKQGGDNSLFTYLYDDQPGSLSKMKQDATTYMVARVTKIDAHQVTIDRPMKTRLDPKWQASVALFQPTVTESGIEKLTIEFPVTPYRGHFSEKGYNALNFGGVAHCWAKNIEIKNADSGLFGGGVHNTFSGIRFVSSRQKDKRGYSGHHGFMFSGEDCLLENFDFQMCFIHDITVASCHSGNVAMTGNAINLTIDNHKRAPHANLFTDIDAGQGNLLFHCGGGNALGKNAGAWTTYWNIRSESELNWPPSSFGPDLMNIVGVKSKQKPQKSKKWFEPISPANIQPQNLYKAQLKRRLHQSSTTH